MKIAVTGGLASGKSSVCQILQACGAYVVSADEIVHRLLTPETAIGKQVIRILGPEILNGQKIDRDKIAQKVFSDLEQLARLEKYLHPAVLDEIERQYQELRKRQKEPLFIAEIPLLYESESHKFFDRVIVVASSEKLCKLRYAAKTGRSSDEFEKRMKRQHHPDHKAAKADYIIENNGTFDELKQKVINLYQTLLN